jgi:hypothetical protein
MACNEQLSQYLLEEDALQKMNAFSFFPPALAGGVEAVQSIRTIMSGGRTYLLGENACEALGWPSVLHLDLNRVGWGHGLLELRPEVKGAGTLFERTWLSPDRLERLLRAHPQLPTLMSSRAEFMKRNVGGQSERNGRQAVAASAARLGNSPIKFVPVWRLVAQSSTVESNLSVVSQALADEVGRYTGSWNCEIRLTPGTVRAVYFDTAESDEELAGLCSRVSNERGDLEPTLAEMITDARRYLEIVARTTMPSGDGFTWVKIGDINETFATEREMRHFRDDRCAWYFAKDEIVVRQLGKFFTDMESYFGKDVGFRSASAAQMRLHHEHFALAVLRDHLRVCAQFLIGGERLAGRRHSHKGRRARAKEIRRLIFSALNGSSHLSIENRSDGVALEICYPGLGDQCLCFQIPDSQLAEIGA